MPRLESDDVSDVRNLSSVRPVTPDTLQSPFNSPLAKGQLDIACSIGFVTRCALCEKVSGDGRAFGFLSRGTVTSVVLNNGVKGRARGWNPAALKLEELLLLLVLVRSLAGIDLGDWRAGVFPHFKRKQSQKTSNVGRAQQSSKCGSLIHHCDVRGFASKCIINQQPRNAGEDSH